MVKNIMQIYKFLTLHFIKRTLWSQVKTKRTQYYEEENLPQDRILEVSGTTQ